MSKSDLIAFVANELQSRADGQKARDMAAYMRTDMPFYGVQAKDRRNIARRAKACVPLETRKQYENAVLELWGQPHREEKYIAVALARVHSAFVVPPALPLYERLIREGAWWDFVDEIAQHLVGGALAAAPAEVWPVMDRWIEDEDLWIRRSAILCQNRFKEETDEGRLFDYCERCAGETDFFIRKAIGWALRQYARTAPEAVKEFVGPRVGVLSPLSVKESLKHLR